MSFMSPLLPVMVVSILSYVVTVFGFRELETTPLKLAGPGKILSWHNHRTIFCSGFPPRFHPVVLATLPSTTFLSRNLWSWWSTQAGKYSSSQSHCLKGSLISRYEIWGRATRPILHKVLKALGGKSGWC